MSVVYEQRELKYACPERADVLMKMTQGPNEVFRRERRVFEWEVGYFQGSVASDFLMCAE